jgi:tetratricopeptide (TPR) repeat protein
MIILTNSLFAISSKSNLLVEEAWKYWGENNYQLVEQKFKEAIQEDENNTRAYIGLSYLYQLHDRNSDAWQQFKNVLHTENNYYPYIFSAMLTPKILLNNNDFDDIQDEILKLYLKTANDPNADMMLRGSINEKVGRYYLRYNNYKKAMKYFNALNAITDWYVIGPFDNISASGFDKNYPPETEIDYSKIYKGKNNINVQWFKINKVRSDRWIDLRRYFAYYQSIFYGNTFVYIPEEKDVQIRVGTSGSLKVFLNDELIIKYFDENNNDLDTYIAEVKLQKGWNRLLVKCGFSEINQCNFLVRITDTSGNSINNLQTSSEMHSYPVKPKTSIKSIKNFAEKYFEEKITQFPNHLENYLLLADCYLRNDKASEAELVLRKAINLVPNNVLFYKHILEAYQRGEKFDEFATTIEKIYNLDANNIDALIYKFGKFIESLNFDEAEKNLMKLEELIPESRKLYRHTIMFYSKKNLTEKIIETVEKAFNRFPDNWEFVKTKALLEYYVNKNANNAIKIINNYLKRKNTEDAYVTLGDLYLRNSDISNWEQTYLNLLKYYPASTGFYYSMANTYYSIQNYNKAKEYILKTIEICPISSLYWEKLGEIYRATNKIEKAIEAYKTALNIYPTYYEAREILRKIQGKNSIFENFESINIDSLIEKAPSGESYPEDNAIILLDDAKKVIYDEGTSEFAEDLLVKVFNNEGIDDWKEYYIPYNSYTQKIIIEEALSIKKDGSKVKADIDGNHIVFKTLETDDFIYLKWKIRNYYSGKLSGHFWDDFNLNLYYPIKELRYSVLIPEEGCNLQYRTQNMIKVPTTKQKIEDGILYQWRLVDEPAIRSEYGMPILDNIGKKLYISTIDSWENLIDWYHDLSHTKTRSCFEIKESVEKLFSGKTNLSENDKIKIIYDFVTENIRYSYLSFRQSAFIPQEARDLLVNRIGDCKDMAAITIAMLKEVDINAYFILLNTNDEGYNRNILPDVVFNHVIVGVDTQNGILYLDPTAKNHPIGTVPNANLNAFALPIKQGLTEPFYLDDKNFLKRTKYRKTTINIEKNNNILVKRESSRTGSQSHYTRDSYRFMSNKDQIKKLTETLSKTYTSVDLHNFTIENIDQLNPEIHYNYSFTAHNYLIDAGGFKIFKLPWTDKLNTRKALSYEKRVYPLEYLPAADFVKENLEIYLPSGYQPVNFKDVNIKYNSHIVDFSLTLTFENGILKGTRELINKKAIVLPEEYLEFKKLYNNIVKADNMQILLNAQ